MDSKMKQAWSVFIFLILGWIIFGYIVFDQQKQIDALQDKWEVNEDASIGYSYSAVDGKSSYNAYGLFYKIHELDRNIKGLANVMGYEWVDVDTNTTPAHYEKISNKKEIDILNSGYYFSGLPPSTTLRTIGWHGKVCRVDKTGHCQ